MYRGKPIIKITDEDVRMYTPLYIDSETAAGCEQTLILTREAFIECYNRWIKGESEENNGK